MNTEPMHQLCLAAIVALSLILPLMASARETQHATGPGEWLRTVWAGQALVAIGALLVLASPVHPAFGVGLAVASCGVFGWRLYRQLFSLQD